MNVKHIQSVIKCPGDSCGENIFVSIGTFLDGINDYGGWVLQCKTCSNKFAYNVKNPDDASSIIQGAYLLDSWDDEVGDKMMCLTNHGLNNGLETKIQNVLLPNIMESKLPKINSNEHHLYHCVECKNEIENCAYKELTDQLDKVNIAVDRFLIAYIKGYANTPEGIRVSLPVKCQCGRVNAVVFYKPFTENSALSEDAVEYWIVGCGGELSLPDIDGVYTRNECFGILDKLLLRWQARFHLTFIIVPFVGLQFPGTERQRLEHWGRVLSHTRPDKTRIITRRATFKLLQQAAEKEGLDISFLKDYGILNETIRRLSDKKAFYKQNSHAKIYCGMSSDGVEVMTGSFNIHDGEYAENIIIKHYSLADFFSRYILNLDIWFDVRVLSSSRSILEVIFDENGVECSVNEYTGSLGSSRVKSMRY